MTELLFLSQIPDAHRLALRTWNLAWQLERNRAAHAESRLDPPDDIACDPAARRIIVRSARRKLDLHGHGIERTLARQHDLIMRRNFRHADQHRLDLRRIDVDAADDHHV